MTMQSETPPSDEELIDRVYGKYTKASRERFQRHATRHTPSATAIPRKHGR